MMIGNAALAEQPPCFPRPQNSSEGHWSGLRLLLLLRRLLTAVRALACALFRERTSARVRRNSMIMLSAASTITIYVGRPLSSTAACGFIVAPRRVAMTCSSVISNRYCCRSLSRRRTRPRIGEENESRAKRRMRAIAVNRINARPALIPLASLEITYRPFQELMTALT